MRLLLVDDVVVIPEARLGSPAAFVSLREKRPLGQRARVREVSEASPRSVAQEVLGVEDGPELEHTAAYVLHELAWLHDAPDGSEVTISDRGMMRLVLSAEHLDAHRAMSREWAKKQRRQGFLPILVVAGTTVRVVGLPWTGPMSLVDVDEVRRRAVQHGVRRIDHLEVL